MIRQISFAVAGLLATAAAGTAADATAFTTFSSRSAFAAASGTLATDTFNTVTSDILFSNGSYGAVGFTMRIEANDRTARTAYIDASPFQGSSIDGTSFAAAALYSVSGLDAALVLTFDKPITSFGADFLSGAGGLFRIDVLGSTLDASVDNPSFFGFVSDTEFSSIRLRAREGSGHYLVMDNVSTGAAAISAAPEPISWAMMVGGFGVIGGALRGRRRTKAAFA